MERVKRWYLGVDPLLAVRLMVLPVMLSILDFSITLSFQPAEYWEGDRMAVMEANPIARWVLIIHPLLIIPAMMAWYVLMFPLIFQTPAKFGLRVIAVHLLAHMIVISGWLIRMCNNAWWWVMLLFLTTAVLSLVLLGPFRSQWNSAKPLQAN